MLITDICMGLGIPFAWRGYGTQLVGGRGASRVIEGILARGIRILGVEGFNVDSTLMHAQPGLAYDFAQSVSDPQTVVSAWPKDYWVDIRLGEQMADEGMSTVDWGAPIKPTGDYQPYLSIAATCMNAGVHFIWHRPGRMLVAGSKARDIIRETEDHGLRILGLRGFGLEFSALHPRFDCIYHTGFGSAGLQETISTWAEDIWIDINLDQLTLPQDARLWSKTP